MSFNITLQPSGHEFAANDGESVLTAGLNHGLSLPYGCRNGACGACKGTIVSGEVDYGERNTSCLSEDDKAAGVILCCQAQPKTDVMINVKELSSAAEIKPKIMPARVIKLHKLSHDVMQLELKLPDSQRMQFLAGQYIEVLLKGGKRRAFSIANAPHQDDVIILQIRHVPDGYFSNHVFDEMQEKALLRIEGPFGGFYLREETERPVIMLGGGTGYAPLNGMLEHAHSLEMKNQFHLFCGVRAKRDIYMQDQVAALTKKMSNLNFTAVLSDPEAADNWSGETGYVHETVLNQFADLSGFDIYMSGPPPMVNAAKAAFMKQGAVEDQMFSDAFEYSADAQKASDL
ncbi:MAG: CDP-6-deoxy-delta-3,4-glucoseen reductase [Gammaproteobacteria bacterium]|nr:CDP-6-deoxy-delta-3,4-glucoseen reductase [Gammaproteobacteria bacterium]